MSQSGNSEDSARIELLREQIKALAAEAVTIFRQDIPYFFETEAKQRFLAQPQWAQSLSDERLHALRQEIRAEAARLTQLVTTRLTDVELWLSANASDLPSSSLRENPLIWQILSQVGDGLRDILQRSDFPADESGEPVEYREPRRFISGHHLPTIAEKYWKRLVEYREACANHRLHEAEKAQAYLSDRWDRS